MSTTTLEPPEIPPQVGRVDHFRSMAERDRDTQLQPDTSTLPLGPIKVVHAFWLAGMSCDGCSIAAVGATSPSVEDLIAGTIPGVPRVVLHHCVLSVESGEEFIHNYEMAESGELGAPYVVIYEGSIADERIAAATGGYFSAMGAEKMADGTSRPIPSSEWLKRLAPGANISSAGSKILGTFMRPMRRITQKFLNREGRWNEEMHVPSGWGHVEEPDLLMNLVHKIYVKYQSLGSKKTWKQK